MSNFGHDDAVLLKWEITGTGRCEVSYSHFNSIMKQIMKAEQSENELQPWFYGVNNSQVKISGNTVVVGWDKYGC